MFLHACVCVLKEMVENRDAQSYQTADKGKEVGPVIMQEAQLWAKKKVHIF